LRVAQGCSTAPTLGLRANAAQFALLVGLNGLVGAMVGLERSVLPLIGKREFRPHVHRRDPGVRDRVRPGEGLHQTSQPGALADRVGRKRLLVLGWCVALPVPLLIGLAPSWSFIVAATSCSGSIRDWRGR